MITAKPTMPAWLGSLLKEQQKPRTEDTDRSEAADFEELLQSSPEIVDDHPQIELGNDDAQAESSAEQIELHLGDDKESPAQVEARRVEPEIEFLDSESPSQPRSETPLPKAEENATIDLSDEHDDWALLDLQMDDGTDSEAIELHGSPLTRDQSSPAEAKPKPRKGSEDETIIELSEEDLEGLFLELENGAKGKQEDDKS